MNGESGSGEHLGHAYWLDAGDRELAGVRVRKVVNGLVPVVPTVVAGEEYLVASGGAPRDLYRDGAGFATALAVADHLRAWDRVDEELGQLDLRRAVDAVQAPPVDLLLDRAVHHRVRVTQDHRAHAIDPVYVLVAIDVDEPGALGAVGVDRADSFGEHARPPADELSPAGG